MTSEPVHHSVKEFVEKSIKEEKEKRNFRHGLLLLVAILTSALALFFGSTAFTGLVVSQEVGRIIRPFTLIVIALAIIVLWWDLRKSKQ